MIVPLPAGGGGQAPLPPGFIESQKISGDKPFDPYGGKSSSDPVVPPQQPITYGPRK